MKNQGNSANFIGHPEAQKRKWPYAESNSYANYEGDKGIIAKKSMTTYNYDNFQPNYIISSNGHEQRHDSVDASVNCSQQSSTQMLNAMEISENIEYVNILYEDDLLTSIQAPVATETNYINFEPNWGNADILDLDQRNYYYENTNTIHLNQLNGQLSQHNEHDTSINHQQITHNDGHLQITDASNSHIHHVTEYEIVQSVYPEAENQQEKSNSNLRKFS